MRDSTSTARPADRDPTERVAALRVCQLVVLIVASAAWAVAAAAGEEPRQIVVKYRSEGAHALEECAEKISTSDGMDFRRHTRDRSGSLDQLVRRHRLGPHRAAFRRATRASLRDQRQRLAAKWARSQREFPRGRDATADSTDALPDLAHVYRIEIPEGTSAEAVMADLRADAHVEYVQPDHEMALDQAFVPNDPFFAGVGAWGQPYRDLWGTVRVRAPEIWSRSQGEGQVVAVVDSGLDDLHPDIVGNVWVNPGEDLDADGIASPSDRNGIDDDGNGFIDDLHGFDFANSIDADADGFFISPEDVSDPDPFDDNGHGSHVAGTIAAVGDNGIGMIGIAPRAKLMPLKGFRAEGSASSVVLWRAVLYAAEMGASVINNSWSCGTPCPDNPLADEVLTIVEALGTVVVTSAGNSTEDVVFRNPENGSQAISVGALTADDRLANFSNRGWLLDVVAPGGGPSIRSPIFLARRNILSVLSSGAPDFRDFFAVDEAYFRFAGTSMSAPHVSGAVALLRSLRPELSPSEIRRLVRMSAQDLGRPGHDPIFGAGVLDIARLIDAELPELDLVIDAPRAGSLHDPNAGALEVTGRAAGLDLAALEIDVASGLRGVDFVPITSFGDSLSRADAGSGLEEGMLARWDTRDVPDGSYVLRVRARLRDGRVVDEYSVVGIERNTPTRLSQGDRPVASPSVSGRQVVWQVDEALPQPTGVVNHDLEIGFFPSDGSRRRRVVREPMPLFEREGEQQNPISEGREVAWDVREGATTTLERCRLDRRRTHCDPRPVSTAPGHYFGMEIGRDWLLWMRRDEAARIEGCRIGRHIEECVPQPIMAPEAGEGWILGSFDGETLFVRRSFSEYARCRLTAEEGACLPTPVSFGVNVPSPVELTHDGALVVFKSLQTEFRLPSGCIEEETAEGCVSKVIPVVRLYGCWLEEGTSSCDVIPLTPTVPNDSLLGMSVSRGRAVWSIADDEERTAIHFCQFVPETNECVDQRLTGALLPESFPSIDRHRIAWEDSRLGTLAIFGFELPRLFSPETTRARAGRRFWTLLLGFPGGAGELRFEVEGIDGFTPEEADARLIPLRWRDDFVILSGRAPRGGAQTARWRLRAVGEGGLYVDRIVEIEVDPARPRRRGGYYTF